MTDPVEEQAPANRYVINLATDPEKKLAQIMFHERVGLRNVFQNEFGIQFEGHFKDQVVFSGDEDVVSKVKRAFAMLAGQVGGGTHIDKKNIRQIAQELNPKGLTASFKAANQNTPATTGSKGGAFVPKNEAQAELAKLIDESGLTFAVGPAGTGKTHVAVVKAITALKEGKIKKILLARPATESGEKIGFLPGDANAKLAPYMRPIYDELDKAFGHGKYQKMMADGVIEIVPIGFMRGRTFEDAFIIVDEAQNCTIKQITMAMTRIGENSKMVITGDQSQIDLIKEEESGLMWAVGKLRGKESVGVQEFKAGDIVRCKLVQTIVDALGDDINGPLPALEFEKKQGVKKPTP